MTQSPDPALRTVFLYGHLAHGIGRKIELAFNAPVDALRLLELNFPGFIQRFKRGSYHVSVRRSGRETDLDEEHLSLGFTGEELHIMPRATGRGKGKSILTAIVGGLIIGAAFFFLDGTLTTALPGIFGAVGGTYGTIATLGMGLVLQGIGGLLSPTPSTDYSEDQKKSYIFNGPVNVTDQGGVVPLVFGKMMCGSIVLSASLDVENDPGTGGGSQSALTPHLHFTQPGQTTSNSVGLHDLVKIPEGGTLTHLNGNAVSGEGTVSLGNNLGMRYNTAGEFPANYYDLPLHLRRVVKPRHVFFTWTAAGDRATRTMEVVTFRVLWGGQNYDGQIRITFGHTGLFPFGTGNND